MNIETNTLQEQSLPLITPRNDTTQATVVDRVAQFVERFVYLPDRNVYQLIATWIIGTYLIPSFEYFGYLFIHSPEPACGKSRLLEVLHELVNKSSGILISPTESALFRTASGMTQLLDEVDGWTNKENLRSVLNAGFHEGGSVPRSEQDAATGGYKVVGCPVYGPKALAGIGLRILDATTRDRTFIIPMVRQEKSERRERFTRTQRQEARAVKALIDQWVKDHRKEVAETYQRAEFPELDDFRDRTIDVSQALVSVLEVAFTGHPKLNDARLRLLDAITSTRKDQEFLAKDHRILEEIARNSVERQRL